MSRNHEVRPSTRVVDILREAKRLENGRAYVMHEMGAGNDEELWGMMADAIEAGYRPVPLMEDGCPVSVGTETRYGRIESFDVHEDGNWLVRCEDRDILEGTYSQRIPLPIAKAEKSVSDGTMSIECPHCGEDLAEHGVVMLVGFLQHPDSEGIIPHGAKAYRLDDTEGYLCAFCNEDLDFDEEQEATRIFGR